MADNEAPASESHAASSGSSGGNALTHKLGPLPLWGWVVVVVGAVIIYKIIHNRTSAAGTGGTVAGQNNAASLFGTEGFSTNSAGQLVDNATGNILGSAPGGTTLTGSGSGVSSAAQWFTTAQQTLFNLGYDSGAVDQALQDYASGNKLPQNEYGIIEAAIRLTGNPPSGITLPELQPPAAPAPTPAPTVAPAPSAPAQAPALPSWLQSAMTSNGEYIVSTAFDNATGAWLYLTQKGGVYGGGYGSIFSLRPGTFSGRTAQSITALPNGGYTIQDTAGENYTFSPTPGSNYAAAGPGNNYTPT